MIPHLNIFCTDSIDHDNFWCLYKSEYLKCGKIPIESSELEEELYYLEFDRIYDHSSKTVNVNFSNKKIKLYLHLTTNTIGFNITLNIVPFATKYHIDYENYDNFNLGTNYYDEILKYSPDKIVEKNCNLAREKIYMSLNNNLVISKRQFILISYYTDKIIKHMINSIYL